MSDSSAPQRSKTSYLAAVGRIKDLFRKNPIYKEELESVRTEEDFKRAQQKIREETGKNIADFYWLDLQTYHENMPSDQIQNGATEEKSKRDGKEHKTKSHGGEPIRKNTIPLKEETVESEGTDEREDYRKELRENAMMAGAKNDEEGAAKQDTTDNWPEPFIPQTRTDTPSEEQGQNQQEMESPSSFPDSLVDEGTAGQSNTGEIIPVVGQASPTFNPQEMLEKSENRIRDIQANIDDYNAAEKRANTLWDSNPEEDSNDSRNSGNPIQDRIKSEIQSRARKQASEIIKNQLKERFGSSSLKEFASKSFKGVSEEGSSLLRTGVEKGANGLTNGMSKLLGRFGLLGAEGGAVAGGAGVATAGAGVTAVGEGAVATAPVWGPVVIAIIILLLLFLLVVILAKNPASKPPTNGVTIIKTGPAQVTNGSPIAYTISVNIPGGTRNVEVTDTLDDNALFDTSTGPNGKYFDKDGNQITDITSSDQVAKIKTIKWTVESTQTATPSGQTGIFTTSWDLVVKPKTNDSYVINVATTNNGIGGPGGGLINPTATSLVQMFKDASQKYTVPAAFLMAINKRETGVIDTWQDSDVQKFSALNWWVNASVADLKAGFAYNTCSDPTLGCSGSDVEGIMQFEIGTWNGIAPSLQFTDNHTPDRRYPLDSVYGAGLFISDIASAYDKQYGTQPSATDWTEDKVRKVAARYCGDPTATACGGPNDPYDIAVWTFYQEYKTMGY